MACCAMLKGWTLLLIIFGVGEKVHLQKVVDQSAPLAFGATEEDVLRAIGEPSIKWEARRGLARVIFGARPAQWIYGTTIDLQTIMIPDLPFPNPLPVKLRILKPYDDDFVIDWTDQKTVAGIKRPQVDMPEELVKLYEPVYFFADLARGLTSIKTE